MFRINKKKKYDSVKIDKIKTHTHIIVFLNYSYKKHTTEKIKFNKYWQIKTHAQNILFIELLMKVAYCRESWTLKK